MGELQKIGNHEISVKTYKGKGLSHLKILIRSMKDQMEQRIKDSSITKNVS